MYMVVAGLGIPAAFRNVTASALVIAWLVGEFIVLLTETSLPLSFYFMADIAVISVIYAKATKRAGNKTYPTIWKQLYCFVTDLTPWDRWVVAIFALGMWPLYLLAIDPWWKWMGLWGLAILQFLFACAEAIASFRNDLKPRAEPPGNGFALAGARRGYG